MGEATDTDSVVSAILPEDLIPDQALRVPAGDAFNYRPIADRIADLSCEAQTPINIALFAPWGSGKSSLFTLVEASLAARQASVKLIRYDAWRYGGRALRRNFIAHTAKALKIPEDDPELADFHRGLYEDQRRVSLNFSRVVREIRHGHLAPLILLTFAFVLLGLLLDVNTILITATVSAVLALVAAIVEAGKVVVERSRPSEDEEFSQRFDRLVRLATDPPREGGAADEWRRRRAIRRADLLQRLGYYRVLSWWRGHVDEVPVKQRPRYKRLIFFIDELDRCSAEDIAETLKALRTFLDAEHCVFLVAADRDAIEAALPKAEQTTPVNQEKPYYTTRGAFLDKIFSHQITLPPLRSRSLAKFARDLALEADRGIWRELAQLSGDSGTAELDLVLYTLIPSHVYSPRRIKVLLNNYATNARMAASRLPDSWPEKRREIAQVTAFQTEFPDFAEDLSLEPRLPRFLLERSRDADSDAPDSELMTTLLKRWKLPVGPGAEPQPAEQYAEESEASEDVSPVPDSQEQPAEPDEMMGERDEEEATHRDHEAQKRAKLRRRLELRRYLERTYDVVGELGRDLFYLRSAGLDVGLDDPELAELIEVEATDSPGRVVDALAGRPTEQLAGAARLLSAMVGDILGPEQARVMSALMATVNRLWPDLSHQVARDVLGALRTYRRANELRDDHLLGALQVAIAVRAEERGLVPEILAEPGLFASPERVAAVIPLGPELTDDEMKFLQKAITEHLTEDHLPLLGAISKQPAGEQIRLNAERGIIDALGPILDREAEEAAAEEDGAEE